MKVFSLVSAVILVAQCKLTVSSELFGSAAFRGDGCGAQCFPQAISISRLLVRNKVPFLNLRGGGSGVRSLLSKAEFDEVLNTAGNKLVVVDFTATWCGPCQRIAPAIDLMAAEIPGVIFVKVDVDANEETSAACKVTCMPTFQFYKNGEKVDEFSGADEAKVRELVKKHE